MSSALSVGWLTDIRRRSWEYGVQSGGY